MKKKERQRKVVLVDIFTNVKPEDSALSLFWAVDSDKKKENALRKNDVGVIFFGVASKEYSHEEQNLFH